MTNKPTNKEDQNVQQHNSHNSPTNNSASPAAKKSQFLECLSEFFKRDLITIPVVKKYPHSAIQQRCGLKAATLELDTAAYPNIEYVAGTRLSVYPTNPDDHVQTIMDHLQDDLSSNLDNILLPPNSVDWWKKFVRIHKANSLRLALTHLFDITIAPSRELIKLVGESCAHQKELRKRLSALASSNEAWEKWVCSGHRTLKSLLDEIRAQKDHSKSHRPLSAVRLLAELEVQTPRQYSISNIKSNKRFRTEIIVFQHKFNLRQIELNLRQLKERETFDKSASSPKSPSLRSSSISGRGSSSPIALRAHQNLPSHKPLSPSRRVPTPGRPAPGAPGVRHVPESSGRSGASMRSIRSLAPFATSPAISTHQVKRVSSFSGPLMSMYASAATSSHAPTGPESSTSGPLDRVAASKHERMRSRMSVLSAPETNFSDPAGAGAASSPSSQTGQPAAHSAPGAADVDAAADAASSKSARSTTHFEGLCSNYLLNLNTNDQIVCEFVENPRFTLKGNRERPIMMIGQDVGLIAFRPFWQQRNLEHDRAQVFYTLFKDLSPKKFGEMQLVCVTGHKSRIEELLFKREINLALASKVLSSVAYINRKHLVGVLSAAHTKSQLVFSQQNAPAGANRATLARAGSATGKLNNSLQITNKELLELGDRMYKLLVEQHGCLYTCCDPHMTQAIEILLFESIARNNSQLSREKIMELLPKWKGRHAAASQSSVSAGARVSRLEGASKTDSRSKSRKERQEAADASNSIFTLENTYERARIVQEIYDNPI